MFYINWDNFWCLIIGVNTKANIFLSEKGDIFRLGLEKTFNVYLNLPKSLWPIVELSEKKENWRDILYHIQEFSVEYIGDNYKFINISSNNKHEFVKNFIPENLYNIYKNHKGKFRNIVISSINKFLLEDERCLQKNSI